MASYTKNTPGYPTGGFWNIGDIVTDSLGIAWKCMKAGQAAPYASSLDSRNARWSPELIYNAGSSPVVDGLSSAEYKQWPTMHKTVISMTAMSILVTDAFAYGSQKLYDFPKGRVQILGTSGSVNYTVGSMQFSAKSGEPRATNINANASLTWGVGSAAASSPTLASTMVDYLPKTTKLIPDGFDYTTVSAASLATISAILDGTGTAKSAYMNLGFETTTDIDADSHVLLTGTVTLYWINLGGY